MGREGSSDERETEDGDGGGRRERRRDAFLMASHGLVL